jgi:hypothetical protein
MDAQGGAEGAESEELARSKHEAPLGDDWWGESFHMTPGDVHIKHFSEPNDRYYDS